MKSPAEIGAVVKEHRERAGLSYTQLAARVDCTEQTIRNIEDGIHGVPTLLAVLCELNVKLGEL